MIFQRFFNVPEFVKAKAWYLWVMSLLGYIMFFALWLIVMGVFLNNFSIYLLPLLFVVDGILLFLSGRLADYLRVKGGNNALRNFIIVGLCFVFIQFFTEQGTLLILSLAILIKSFFLPVLRINLFKKIEESFTPKDAQKVIPMIESSETIGALIGALYVFLYYYSFQGVEILSFIFLLLIGYLCMVVYERKFVVRVNNVSKITKNSEKKEKSSLLLQIRKKTLYICISLIILLQSTLFVFVEYRFVEDIYESSQEETAQRDDLMIPQGELEMKNLTNSLFESFEKVSKETVEKIKSVLHEDFLNKNISHDLSFYGIVIALVAIIFQFIITPFCLRFTGVWNTMFLYFLGFLTIVAGLFFNKPFNFELLRIYQHGGNSLFFAPYHLIFYGIPNSIREKFRVFLMTSVVAIAHIFGGILVFVTLSQPTIIGFLAIFFLLSIMGLVYISKKIYSKNLVNNSQNTEEKEEQFHFLEMLEGKNNKEASEYLKACLINENDENMYKEIINILESYKEESVIHTYLEILKSKEQVTEKKIAILKAIKNKKKLQEYMAERAFTKESFRCVLINLFNSTNRKHIKKIIIICFSLFMPQEFLIKFMQEIFKGKNPELISVALRSCKKLNDPEVKNFVGGFINHKNSRISSHAVIAVWETTCDKKPLQNHLKSLLYSKNIEDRKSAIYSIGEVADKSFEQDLSDRLRFGDFTKEEEIHIVLSLLKLGSKNVWNKAVNMIISEANNNEMSHSIFNMKDRIQERIREKFETKMRYEIIRKINKILQRNNVKTDRELKNLKKEEQDILKRLYSYLGEYAVISLLNKKNS